MSPRTSASNFITTMAGKRAKHHMPQLMVRLVEVMNAYAAAGEHEQALCSTFVRLSRALGVAQAGAASWLFDTARTLHSCRTRYKCCGEQPLKQYCQAGTRSVYFLVGTLERQLLLFGQQQLQLAAVMALPMITFTWCMCLCPQPRQPMVDVCQSR